MYLTIHLDQTGFIPGRVSFFNVRHLMSIVYGKHPKYAKMAIVAPESQKAFDQVELNYLLEVIKESGLGESFASWVQMLHASTTASVRTHFNRSRSFPPFSQYSRPQVQIQTQLSGNDR